MRTTHRFSQAIAEGDGISLLAEVADAASAGRAEEDGAEGVVVRSSLAGIRDATQLPILWFAGPAEHASTVGADACVLAVEGLEDEDGRLEELAGVAVELGLDAVVEVRNEDELQVALDRLDPEILLLSARETDGDELEHVLSLLPDVPAGKLAVAYIRGMSRDEIDELERAGVDAVIIPSADVVELAAGSTQPS